MRRRVIVQITMSRVNLTLIQGILGVPDKGGAVRSCCDLQLRLMRMWAPGSQSRTLAPESGSADGTLLPLFLGNVGHRGVRGRPTGPGSHRPPPWVRLAAHSNEVTKNAKNAALTPK